MGASASAEICELASSRIMGRAMMAVDVARPAAPSHSKALRFVCPRCRAPLALETGVDRCSSCELAVSRSSGIVSFVAPAGTDRWLEFFESSANAPGSDTASGVGYRFPIQQRYVIEAFRRLSGDLPTSALVLDVGCGNGLFCESLFGDRPVVGVDYSLGMCRLAEARGMQVYQADARALPFAAAQFDLIYSSEVVQCIEPLPPFMAELARVCRPGGRIIISTLNRSSLLRRAARFTRRIFLPPSAENLGSLFMRSAEDMLAAVPSNLRFGRVCWTHFPFPWLRCFTNTRYFLKPLASNLVVEFIKVAR